MTDKKIDWEKRKILLKYFQDGRTRREANEYICKKYGNCIGFGMRTCERWFKKFREGDIDISIKPRDKSYKKRDRTYHKKKRPAKKVKKVKEIKEIQFKQKDVPAPKDSGKNLRNAKPKNPPPKRTPRRQPAAAAADATNVLSPNRAVAKKSTSKANKAKKRRLLSPPKLIPVNTAQNNTPAPLEMPNLRQRRSRRKHSQDIQIQLPESTAKRMIPQTLTERHSIRDTTTRTAAKSSEPTTATAAAVKNNASRSVIQNKQVTVQFQNVTPEVAKNTVYRNPQVAQSHNNRIRLQHHHTNPISNSVGRLKIAKVAHIERMSPQKSTAIQKLIPEILNTHKRIKLHKQNTSTPVSNSKGMIYLNPEEIFPQRFNAFTDAIKPLKTYGRPIHLQSHKKPPLLPSVSVSSSLVSQAPSQLPAAAPANASLQPSDPPPPSEIHESVVLSDTDDSDDDVVLPEDIPLPAPKLKADETFTTYWEWGKDSDEPKLLNLNNEPVVPVAVAVASTPVIEID